MKTWVLVAVVILNLIVTASPAKATGIFAFDTSCDDGQINATFWVQNVTNWGDWGGVEFTRRTLGVEGEDPFEPVVVLRNPGANAVTFVDVSADPDESYAYYYQLLDVAGEAWDAPSCDEPFFGSDPYVSCSGAIFLGHGEVESREGFRVRVNECESGPEGAGFPGWVNLQCPNQQDLQPGTQVKLWGTLEFETDIWNITATQCSVEPCSGLGSTRMSWGTHKSKF